MKITNKFVLTTIALAAMTSTSVYAGGIDLVKTNDVTINFNGDIDLIVKNMDDSENTQIEANFDDIDFDFSYRINNDFSFVAQTDWTVEFQDDDPVKNGGVSVGFIYKNNTILVGYLAETSFDPLGIDNAEVIDVGMASGDTDGDGTSHESAIRYDFQADNLWISATYGRSEYAKSDNSSGTGTDSTLPEVMQVAAIGHVGDFQIAGGIGHTETIEYANGSATKATTTFESAYGQGELEYNYGQGTVAILLSHQDMDVTSVDTNVKTYGFEFDAKYNVTSKFTIMTGFDHIEQDINTNTDNDSLTYAYVGSTYKFSPVVTLYTELGHKKGDFWKYGKTSSSTYDQTQVALMLGLDF